MIDVIRSERLDLLPLSPDFFAEALRGNRAAMERHLGARIPDDWPPDASLLEMRQGELRADPGLQPWLLRALVLRRERRMVGHAGFHTAPDPAYLREIAPGGIELGYEILPADRRVGYAEEAIQALLGWARRAHGVHRFVVSISPRNAPSMRLAAKLGFVRIGSHVDEVDGPEDILELRDVRDAASGARVG